MKSLLLAFVPFLFIGKSHAQQKEFLLHDIYLSETENEISFGNDSLTIAFNKATGKWQGL
jgi:hypothetical protein